MKALLITTFSFTLLLHSATAQERVDASIDSIINRYRAVGLAVAVVKNNEMAFVRSFGLKDAVQPQPLSRDDIFRIASISKSFTATAIMQFVDKRKVSLDDDFSALVGFPVRNPKYPDAVITLRMVMSHTSSVNDTQGYFDLDVINPAKNKNWALCYNNYAPGMGYQYCNLNYNMTGAVLEKLSGERFDETIRHQIVEPLGLHAGYCVDSLDASKFVTLYAFDSVSQKFKASPEAYTSRKAQLANYIVGYSAPLLSPTGGMKISANDLALYMMMHMNYGKSNGKRIISRKSAKEMQKPLSDVEHYGLALLTNEKIIKGQKLTGHTGSAYGLYSAMFFEPKKKFGIVVITNGCLSGTTDSITDILKDTVNVLYREIIASRKRLIFN